jgi:AcrR family transcriptional regulator
VANAGRGVSPRKRVILDAALACFDTKGVAATTIEDVRAASGASIGSLYHHFGAKDHLVGFVYRECLRAYHSSLLEALPAFRTAESLVKGIVEHYLAWVKANPRAARFLLETRHAESVRATEAEILADTAVVVETVGASLERFVASGEIRALPRPLYSALLIGPCQFWAAQHLRAGDDDSAANRAGKVLADAAWRSIAADPGGNERRGKR